MVLGSAFVLGLTHSGIGNIELFSNTTVALFVALVLSVLGSYILWRALKYVFGWVKATIKFFKGDWRAFLQNKIIAGCIHAGYTIALASPNFVTHPWFVNTAYAVAWVLLVLIYGWELVLICIGAISFSVLLDAMHRDPYWLPIFNVSILIGIGAHMVWRFFIKKGWFKDLFDLYAGFYIVAFLHMFIALGLGYVLITGLEFFI